MRAVHFTLACVSEYESQVLGCPRLKMLDSISTEYRSALANQQYAVKPPGFSHCCGKTRKGKFAVLRVTSAKRMRSKLVAVNEQLRRRMHQTIAEQERYLSAMVIRHVR